MGGLTACGGGSDLPLGEAALPPAGAAVQPTAVAPEDYRLGPRDVIAVNVFQEPDLSAPNLPVSLGGNISLPLLGELAAAGKTTGQLTREITALLNARYLRNARVAISIVKAVNFTVTVDGQVRRPGVYEIPGGRLSLLQAVALGEGATELAKLSEVVIIRSVGGRRYAARFDLKEIRAARAPDPQVRQSDIVVVGYSQSARLLQLGVAALPGAAGIFVALGQN